MDQQVIATGAAGVGVYGVLRAIIRWATTFYQLDERHLRFRTGLLIRRRMVVERSLIRNVTLRANAIAQLCRVTTVEASAAQHKRDVAIRIRSIPRGDARELRDALLGIPSQPADPVVLMRGRPWWSLFAPFSSTSVSLWAGT